MTATHDTLMALLAQMPPEEREWIVGRDTADGLHEAFGKKRVVHAGRGGVPIMNPAEQQRLWTELMAQEYRGDGRSVYIHIPFCDRKCLYCGFFQNFSSDELMDNYVDALVEELAQAGGTRRLEGRPIEAVYFGGGTPSALSPENLGRIMTALRAYLPLANDCEITLEGRMNDFTPDYVDAVLALGINRISIGVQSFDTRVRKSVGRIDDKRTVIDRLDYMVRTGNVAVIIDLMFGLPYQTMENWQEDLDIQYDLGIHGGDMYQLNIFPDSDLHRAIESGKLPAGATTAQQADMFVHALEDMRMRGAINRVDVSHWANGRRERSVYNTLTKGHRDIIQFGCGAGGKLSGYAMMNYRSLPEYIDAVMAGRKPIQFMTGPQDNYAFTGEIIRHLEGMYLDGRELMRKWQVNPVEELRPVLNIWEQKGLVTVEGDLLRMTPAGQFWHDNLIQSVTEMMSMLEREDVIAPRVDDVARQDELLAEDTPTEMPKADDMFVSMMMTQMAKYMDDERYADHPHVLMMKEALAKMGMTDADLHSPEQFRQLSSALMDQMSASPKQGEK